MLDQIIWTADIFDPHTGDSIQHNGGDIVAEMPLSIAEKIGYVKTENNEIQFNLNPISFGIIQDDKVLLTFNEWIYLQKALNNPT